jgi:hypothetical protein
VAVAAVGVLVALALAYAVAVLANRGDVDIRLGDDVFNAGQVENIVRPIDREGPLLFADVAGRGRPIYVQHLGDDEQRGWYAFSAFVPDQPGCTVEWVVEDDEFVDCRGETYLRDGTGLRQYPTTVEDGKLYVDLNPSAATDPDE